MTDTSDIGSEVFNRIEDIPASVSIGSVKNYVEFAINDVENFTGDSIPTGDIQDKYKNILVNLGAAYTLGRKLGVGVDFDFKLGELEVDKANMGKNADSKQLQFYIQQVNQSMRAIGRKTHKNKVWGV